ELSPGMITGLCRDVGGGFAPRVNVHETQAFALPPDLPERAAVMIEPFSVALAAVFDNLPGPGERVLVVGGGVIGSLVVHALTVLECGCEITVVEPGEFAAEFAQKAGAHHIVRDGDIGGAAVRLAGATSHRPVMGAPICTGGFDRVFDTVGNSATLNACLRAMTVRGTLSVIGVGHDVHLDLTPLWLKVQTIQGVYAYGVVKWKGRKVHVYEAALELAAQNPDFLASMVTHEFPLSDWRDMIRVNLAKGRHRAMKTVAVF
ncbi:MAG: zinc-binding dehydrogenase, partial [Pseudomonadota bacterium]